MIRAPATGLQIVLYHHLADRPTKLVDRLGVTTAPELFDAHLARLERDYDIVDLDQVLGRRLPRRPLLITFDDGYRSILDIAGPLLKRRGLPSLFFVSGAFVEPDSLPLDNLLCWLSHEVGLGAIEEELTGRPPTGSSLREMSKVLADLPYARRSALGDDLAQRFSVDRALLRCQSGLFLEEGELGRLADFGIEVGNHTRNHVHCRALEDDGTGHAELVAHRERLEVLTGAAVRAFSYPYGSARDAHPAVERMLHSSGHQARFLVESRPNPRRPSGAAWNRVSIQDAPVSRLWMELEVLPRLRVVRDRLPAMPGRASATCP